MAGTLSDLASRRLPPGRYRLGERLSVRVLRDRLAGWTVRLVDGAAMTDRDALLDEFAVACDFPDWFGRNWDAFVDCLRDLSWLPDRPLAVLWQRAGVLAAADPDLFARSGRILDRVIADRAEMDLSPLYVLYPPDRAVPGEALNRL